MLDSDLAKELVVEPEAVKFARGQEVGHLRDASLRMLPEMPDERMLELEALEGLVEVGGDGAFGMHDAIG